MSAAPDQPVSGHSVTGGAPRLLGRGSVDMGTWSD